MSSTHDDGSTECVGAEKWLTRRICQLLVRQNTSVAKHCHDSATRSDWNVARFPHASCSKKTAGFPASTLNGSLSGERTARSGGSRLIRHPRSTAQTGATHDRHRGAFCRHRNQHQYMRTGPFGLDLPPIRQNRATRPKSSATVHRYSATAPAAARPHHNEPRH